MRLKLDEESAFLMFAAVFLSLSVYGSALLNGCVFNGGPQVLENPLITGIWSVPKKLLPDVRGFESRNV